MKTDFIRQMLEDGKSPEDIYKLAQETQKKVDETREEDKRVAETRASLLKAIDEYVATLMGDHIGVDGIKELEKSFIKFEKSYKDLEDYKNRKKDKDNFFRFFFI